MNIATVGFGGEATQVWERRPISPLTVSGRMIVIKAAQKSIQNRTINDRSSMQISHALTYKDRK